VYVQWDMLGAMSQPRVLIVSARLGGGHDGAAKAIAGRLVKAGTDVRIVDFLDAAPRLGRIFETVFRVEVERAPWAYRLEFELWSHVRLLTRLARRVFRAAFARHLVEWIDEADPDVILATHPFPAQLLGELRRRDHAAVRGRHLATFLTDFSVHPMWVHPAIDVHFAVSDSAALEATRRAHLAGPVVRVGPFVDERFFDLPPRTVARARLGLAKDATVALVVGGSWGVGKLLQTAEALAREPDITPVLLCGRNEELLARARTLAGVRAVGWTTDVDWWLAASDVVIQNAGGLSALEAMAAGRPVISYEPIVGHGTENVAAMAASGVTYWARSTAELAQAVRHFAADPTELTTPALAQFRPDPERELLALLSGDLELSGRYRRRRVARRAATSLVALGGLFVASNVVSGLIGYQGLNLSAAARRSHTVYMGALLSPAALASPAVQRLLVADHICAVVTAHEADHAPGAVAAAADDGVTIANGGAGSRIGDLSFIVPVNDLEVGRRALGAVLDTPVNVYVPQNTINAIDLGWAALHHQSVVPARILTSASEPPVLGGGLALELAMPSATPERAVATLRALVARVRAAHLETAPLAALARAPELSL